MENQGKNVILPVEVKEALNYYVNLVDHSLPGKIQGLYITGSIALNDYFPRKSDIDFVSVSDNLFSEEDLITLSRIHTRIRKTGKYPQFDGIYVTWNELKMRPETLSVPFYPVHKSGKIKHSAPNPVIWHMLAHYPLAIRGPRKPRVYSNEAELRNWCKGNVNAYWRKWVQNAKSKPLRILYSLSPLAVTWGVLGIVRLHATIATGNIISKTKAADYGIDTFPKEWEGILNTARTARITQGYNFIFNPFLQNPFIQRMRALRFMEYVIEEADKINVLL